MAGKTEVWHKKDTNYSAVATVSLTSLPLLELVQHSCLCPSETSIHKLKAPSTYMSHRYLTSATTHHCNTKNNVRKQKLTWQKDRASQSTHQGYPEVSRNGAHGKKTHAPSNSYSRLCTKCQVPEASRTRLPMWQKKKTNVGQMVNVEEA